MQVRYALIFRLDRNAQVDGPTYELPKELSTAFGNYSLPDVLGAAWIDGERGIFSFGARARHCLVGYVTVDPATAEGAETAGSLDLIDIGTPVRAVLQPLTPRKGGRLGLGPEYVAHPRLAAADYKLTIMSARRELTRIGCPSSGRDITGARG